MYWSWGKSKPEKKSGFNGKRCTSSGFDSRSSLNFFQARFSLNCLTLFRPRRGEGGFWGPRQLWSCITSWGLKLSPPNLATFPKSLLETFWHLHLVIINFYVSMATSFWQPCFPIFISMVYDVICFFSLSLATIYQITYNLAHIIPISVKVYMTDFFFICLIDS